MTRQERKDITEYLLELHPQVEAELKKIPGVLGVGIGLKKKGGSVFDKIVYRVLVEEKRISDQIAKNQWIPSLIFGIQTDVYDNLHAERTQLPIVKDGADADCPDSSILQPRNVSFRRMNPIQGGIMISKERGGPGTLGCLAKRITEDDWVILSNFHVLVEGGGVVKTYNIAEDEEIKIFQPKGFDSSCCGTVPIGKVLLGQLGEDFDCAIASIEPGIEHRYGLRGLPNESINGSAAPYPGEIVKKIGMITGLTYGVVDSIRDPKPRKNNYGLEFRNQLTIRRKVNCIYPKDKSGNFVFADYGDSGSVILNMQNQVIGLLWGGVDLTDVTSDDLWTCNPIQDVESILGIYFPTSQEGTHRTNLVKPREIPSNRNGSSKFLDKLLNPDFLLGNLFERHIDEMRNLIGQQREVTVTWHRNHGPSFITAFNRTTYQDGFKVPETIRGVSFGELLHRMANALETAGSPALASDIRQYGMGWIPKLRDCRTIEELLITIDNIENDYANDNQK